MSTPILVTGSHRSGTTWVGKLLAASPETFYIHEPLNVELWPSWTASTPAYWYSNLDAFSALWREIENCAELRYPLVPNLKSADSLRGYGSVVKRYALATHGRLRRKRAVIKDPFMLFNAESFSERFSAPVILTVREPAAFVSSLIRRGWMFDFNNLLQQSALMAGDLAEWAEEVERAAAAPPSLLDQGILLWRVLNGYIWKVHNRTPAIRLAIYEELVSDVRAELPKLYRDARLDWTPEIESRISVFTSGERTHRDAVDVTGDSKAAAREWEKGLRPDQVDIVREKTWAEARHFYSE